MRAVRWFLSLLLTGSALLLGLLVLYHLGALAAPTAARPQPMPRGDREIAWIHAATNSATWERFVAGVHNLKESWPDLAVQSDRAFPDQTARVPEIVLGLAGQPHQLRIRWYKLTSEMGIDEWVRALAGRDPAPLAIIGGGSSDRARDLAVALRRQGEWRGPAPLLLITTATADCVLIDDPAGSPDSPPGPAKLMELYPDRTFRFCFQNSQMAEAVLDFVWSQPD